MALLLFGVPQLSHLVSFIEARVPLAGRMNAGWEYLVIFGLEGAGTGFQIGSSQVAFSCLMLHPGRRWWRFTLAAVYLLVLLAVGMLTIAVVHSHELPAISATAGDLRWWRSVVSLLLMGPVLAFTSVFLAAGARFLAGWSLQRGPAVSHPVDLGTLLEWVLVGALLLAMTRYWLSLQTSSALAAQFDVVLLLFPTIAAGLVTLLLIGVFLSAVPSSGRAGLLVLVLAVHAALAAASVRMLLRIDPTMTIRQAWQYAVAPLAACLVSTLHIAAICWCLRKLGYRLKRR
ncbi:hypothetical protein FYK55_10585 [Roseiconus nitratireducens]|uniref:Uncharacterized protein n=1 Tax=Roseiconus nitratireducens TaxID=2605748 RepID=A0A5M6D7Z5_9BACT|nr:hypothetical protein [Roseiconus nitratireducens]KAA5543647.1 hypothetical protein FYK55_10585 [Roseiconus nitratireducens]